MSYPVGALPGCPGVTWSDHLLWSSGAHRCEDHLSRRSEHTHMWFPSPVVWVFTSVVLSLSARSLVETS